MKTKNNTSRTPSCPYEQQEAEAFVWWLRSQGIMHHHGNDNMHSRSWAQRSKMKRAGFSRGFPDFTVVLPDHAGLIFIELKREKGGAVSQDQKNWLLALNSCPGICAYLCRGAEEAITRIQNHLTKKQP